MNQAPYSEVSSSGPTPSTPPDVEAPPEQTQVFLIDNHPAIREALSSAITGKAGVQVAGDCARAAEALPHLERHPPDVVVTDLSLEGKDGLTLIQELRSRVPEVRILVFSMYDEDVYAERTLRAGASGYVMKTAPMQKMVRAIEEVSAGKVYLSQQITSRVLSKVIRTKDYSASFQLAELTDRELTVFRRLGEGYSVRQIARQLDLNRKTIEGYRREAKEKLGFETVNELLQYAVRWTSEQG